MKTLFTIFKVTWRLCLAAIGLTFVGSELNDTFVRGLEFDWFVDTAIVLIGVLMMVPLIRFMKDTIEDWKIQFNDDSYVALLMSKTKALLQSGEVVKTDFNEQETLLTQFRESYNQFFYEQGKGIKENTALQNTATQLYWNTLSLQKRRLDKMGIAMSLKTQRMIYGNDVMAVNGEEVFDGKYKIAYLSEMIYAVRSFFKDGKRIAKFKSKEVARYRTLDTKKNEKGLIVCPNCGNLSTRENLIDGCDYCGTKFMVDDLGMRVSDFGIYPDADVEYKKYKDSRSKYGIRVGLLIGIISLLFMIYDTIDILFFNKISDEGILFDLGIMIIATVVVMEISAAIAEGIFFLVIFPILQAKASFAYLGQKELEALRASETNNQEAEERIRKYDPLFSLGGFYSNLQNKLAVLHYADTTKEMESFGEGYEFLEKIDRLPNRYKKVVNMDVASMILNDYAIKGEFQKINVTANLTLLEAQNSSISKRNEKVCITLIKDKSCLTQAVSGPEILSCKSCGASISLLDGCTCKYCGNVRHLSRFDWAIEDYEVL